MSNTIAHPKSNLELSAKNITEYAHAVGESYWNDFHSVYVLGKFDHDIDYIMKVIDGISLFLEVD